MMMVIDVALGVVLGVIVLYAMFVYMAKDPDIMRKFVKNIIQIESNLFDALVESGGAMKELEKKIEKMCEELSK